MFQCLSVKMPLCPSLLVAPLQKEKKITPPLLIWSISTDLLFLRMNNREDICKREIVRQ